MASISLTIPGTEIIAPDFVGTYYVFSKTGLGDTEAECKHHDVARKKFKKQKVNCMKIEQNDLILSIKCCVKKWTKSMH